MCRCAHYQKIPTPLFCGEFRAFGKNCVVDKGLDLHICRKFLSDHFFARCTLYTLADITKDVLLFTIKPLPRIKSEEANPSKSYFNLRQRKNVKMNFSDFVWFCKQRKSTQYRLCPITSKDLIKHSIVNATKMSSQFCRTA